MRRFYPSGGKMRPINEFALFKHLEVNVVSSKSKLNMELHIHSRKKKLVRISELSFDHPNFQLEHPNIEICSLF